MRTEIPSLIVFDLDFTLWDCGGMWVDCTSPPFRKTSPGNVLDSAGRHLRFYDDVPAILDRIEELGCQTALASRTDQPTWARELLSLLGIPEHFDFEEIYPGSKVNHFARLSADSGLGYDEMLFFDDEPRNIREVGELGVTCVHITSGICLNTFQTGLSLFRDR